MAPKPAPNTPVPDLKGPGLVTPVGILFAKPPIEIASLSLKPFVFFSIFCK